MRKLFADKHMIFVLFALYVLVMSNQAHAIDLSAIWSSLTSKTTTTLGTIFANFDKSGRVAIGLVKYGAFLVSLILLIIAANKFIRHGQGKETISSAVWSLGASIFLFSMMPAVDTFSQTMGIRQAAGGTELSNLVSSCSQLAGVCDDETASKALEAQMQASLIGLVTFIRLIGFIAVFKGGYALHEMGSQGGGRKSFWSALMFVAAGVGCINIIEVALIIGNTFVPNSGYVDFFENGVGKVVLPSHLGGG